MENKMSAFGGKKNYIWGGLVLAVILVSLGIWQYNYGPEDSAGTIGSQTEDEVAQEEATTTPEEVPTGGKLSYGEALKKYQYRMQFANCSANPGTIALKRNQPLMLDNRDKATHTIRVAGKVYTVKGYDYALAYIATAGDYNLTCDGGGSAKVNVQK